ncbi:DUF6444 domain-containing protein [Vibrio cyclitrophicus]
MNGVKGVIDELWEQLQHYEDKLTASSKNSSKSPYSDKPKENHMRKKLKALITEMMKRAFVGVG